MYIIRNNTEGKVILGDLNIIINFREEVDLEKRLSRDSITKSNNLKHAINKKIITVVSDVDEQEIVKTIEKTTIIESVDNSKQLEDMEKRLRDHFVDELKKVKSADIDDKMDLILNAIKSGIGTNAISNPNEVENFEDDEKMSTMHRKVIERISKNSSAKIQSEHTQVKDSGVADKADELEGLV
jgi:hypothetical protein